MKKTLNAAAALCSAILLSACSANEYSPAEDLASFEAWLTEANVSLPETPVSIEGMPVSWQDGAYRLNIPVEPGEEPISGDVYILPMSEFADGLQDIVLRKITTTNGMTYPLEVDGLTGQFPLSRLGEFYVVVQTLEGQCYDTPGCKLPADVKLVASIDGPLSGRADDEVVQFSNLSKRLDRMRRYDVTARDICGFDPDRDPVPELVAKACKGRVAKIVARDNKLTASDLLPFTEEGMKEYIIKQIKSGKFVQDRTKYADSDAMVVESTETVLNASHGLPFKPENVR